MQCSTGFELNKVVTTVKSRAIEWDCHASMMAEKMTEFDGYGKIQKIQIKLETNKNLRSGELIGSYQFLSYFCEISFSGNRHWPLKSSLP